VSLLLVSVSVSTVCCSVFMWSVQPASSEINKNGTTRSQLFVHMGCILLWGQIHGMSIFPPMAPGLVTGESQGDFRRIPVRRLERWRQNQMHPKRGHGNQEVNINHELRKNYLTCDQLIESKNGGHDWSFMGVPDFSVTRTFARALPRDNNKMK
jgi:hypothetical protein